MEQKNIWIITPLPEDGRRLWNINTTHKKNTNILIVYRNSIRPWAWIWVTLQCLDSISYSWISVTLRKIIVGTNKAALRWNVAFFIFYTRTSVVLFYPDFSILTFHNTETSIGNSLSIICKLKFDFKPRSLRTMQFEWFEKKKHQQQKNQNVVCLVFLSRKTFFVAEAMWMFCFGHGDIQCN